MLRRKRKIVRKQYYFSITLDVFIICNYFRAEINSESVLIWKTPNLCKLRQDNKISQNG